MARAIAPLSASITKTSRSEPTWKRSAASQPTPIAASCVVGWRPFRTRSESPFITARSRRGRGFGIGLAERSPEADSIRGRVLPKSRSCPPVTWPTTGIPAPSSWAVSVKYRRYVVVQPSPVPSFFVAAGRRILTMHSFSKDVGSSTGRPGFPHGAVRLHRLAPRRRLDSRPRLHLSSHARHYPLRTPSGRRPSVLVRDKEHGTKLLVSRDLRWHRADRMSGARVTAAPRQRVTTG
jgi:hypothetical protein